MGAERPLFGRGNCFNDLEDVVPLYGKDIARFTLGTGNKLTPLGIALHRRAGIHMSNHISPPQDAVASVFFAEQKSVP